MPESPIFVGIDVAQVELEVALRTSAEGWAVSNDAAGIAMVVARLQAVQPALIVLEATGQLAKTEALDARAQEGDEV